MNSATAINISIIGFLASIGVKPETVKNGAAWYRSPFSDNQKPTFRVDRRTNLWFDHETQTGGDLLDLVTRLNKTGITGALLILQMPELNRQLTKIKDKKAPFQNRVLSCID